MPNFSSQLTPLKINQRDNKTKEDFVPLSTLQSQFAEIENSLRSVKLIFERILIQDIIWSDQARIIKNALNRIFQYINDIKKKINHTIVKPSFIMAKRYDLMVPIHSAESHITKLINFVSNLDLSHSNNIKIRSTEKISFQKNLDLLFNEIGVIQIELPRFNHRLKFAKNNPFQQPE